MSARRCVRRGEGAQAAFEMALVLPIMLAITLLFIGTMLAMRAGTQLRTAVDLAAQASIVPPLGDRVDICADAGYAFTHTLNPGAYINATTVSEGGAACPAGPSVPLNCDGPYAMGEIAIDSHGAAEPMTCSASIEIDYSRSPVGLLWFWTVRLSATAHAVPSIYRGCARVGGGPSCQPS